MSAYCDEVRLKLTGDILDLDLDDNALQKLINSAFREIQRYIDTTRLATIMFKPCIDLSECGVAAVTSVFRADTLSWDSMQAGSQVDPLYASQWQLLMGNTAGYNMSNWIYNYAAWNTVKQITNTLSTDLAFRFDRHTNKLYINAAYNKPQYITIEYIPRYDDVSQIVSDYWIDLLVRLAVALTKVTVGRVRSRYTQSNALWTQDGETLVSEGNAELEEIRTHLRDNNMLILPID